VGVIAVAAGVADDDLVRRDAERGQQLELNVAPHRIGVRGDGRAGRSEVLAPAAKTFRS